MNDPKAIEACVKALNSSLESVGTKLAVATACVVFGLLIEYWDDAIEAFKAIGNCIWYRRLSDWNALERHVRTAFIGGIFITCGVAAELWCEHRTNVLEGQLQTENGILIAILNGKAAVLDNSTQQLKTSADNANREAELERLARVNLESEVNPRRLTPDEEKDIAGALKPYAGKTVGVATYTQDAEAMILAVQIANCLGRAKILTHNRIGTFGAMGFPLAFSVIVDKNSPNKKLELALFKALKNKGKLATFDDIFKIGEGSTMYMPAGPTHEDAFIFIGEKPLSEEMPPSQTTSKGTPKTK